MMKSSIVIFFLFYFRVRCHWKARASITFWRLSTRHHDPSCALSLAREQCMTIDSSKRWFIGAKLSCLFTVCALYILMSELLYLHDVNTQHSALCSFQTVICIGLRNKVIFLELCSIGIIASSVFCFLFLVFLDLKVRSSYQYTRPNLIPCLSFKVYFLCCCMSRFQNESFHI